MARKTETVLTFQVRLKVPTGSNAHEMQLFLREAIASHSHEGEHLHEADFTVSLKKKETNYA